jgi:lipopolysaccharide/colanic/teichoic acid biosynthesis glycosyltransferase
MSLFNKPDNSFSADRQNGASDSRRTAESHVHPSAARGKRIVDLTVAASALLMTSPLFPVIAVAIRLETRGPVFFRQLRIGRAWADRVELFEMVKFRTMVADAEAQTGPVWAGKDDPRITRVGRFLRKTRLDELPQLWNVIKGEMSLIGPRPERPGICHRLEREIPFFAERTYGLAPGITGLAQVNQGYDETLDDVRRKVGYDHGYALALSSPGGWITADLNIALRTLLVMAGGRGR